MKKFVKLYFFYKGMSLAERYPYRITLFGKIKHNIIAVCRKSLVIGGMVATVALIAGVSAITYREVSPKIVMADKEVIVEVVKDSVIMEKIADCESGARKSNGKAIKGSATHIDPKTGQVYTKSNENKTVDIGRYMVNEYYWGKIASGMKLDLTKEADNKKMAYYIYDTKGTAPWSASSSCWNE